MITAEFYLRENRFSGFSIRGHAGYASAGNDVACAAVSSATELTANAITEVVKADAAVDVFENEVKLVLSGKASNENRVAVQFLQAMRLQMELIAGEYPGSIRIHDLEV